MKIYIFFGPAGSGKGTQAEILSSKLGYHQLSMGDLLRAEIAAKSEIGLQAKQVMDTGNLVSDDIIMKIVKSQLSILKESTEAIILDGFPRTLNQASQLSIILNELSLSIEHVFFFDLSLEDSLIRISGRLIDSRTNRVYHKRFNPPPIDVQPHLITRDDDQEEKVVHRYNVYSDLTKPLIKFYSDRLVQIDCNQSIDLISTIILDKIMLHKG